MSVTPRRSPPRLRLHCVHMRLSAVYYDHM